MNENHLIILPKLNIAYPVFIKSRKVINIEYNIIQYLNNIVVSFRTTKIIATPIIFVVKKFLILK